MSFRSYDELSAHEALKNEIEQGQRTRPANQAGLLDGFMRMVWGEGVPEDVELILTALGAKPGVERNTEDGPRRLWTLPDGSMVETNESGSCLDDPGHQPDARGSEAGSTIVS